MKNHKLLMQLFFSVFTIFLIQSCDFEVNSDKKHSQESKMSENDSTENKMTAVQYNNKIINMHEDIIAAMQKFNDLLHDSSSTKEELFFELDNVSFVADSSIEAVKELGGFKYDTDLVKAAVHLFEFYKKTADKDYRTCVKISKKPIISPSERKKYDEILENVMTIEDSLDDIFLNAQKNFIDFNDNN